MSSMIIIFYVLITLFIGIYKKVNCYQSFITGIKEGLNTVVNMFSSILSFVVAVNLLNSCGIIEDMERLFNNSYINPFIIIQGLIRPFSGSSSMAILINNYEKYPIDSFVSISSTLIHTLTDTSFYIITFYFGFVEVKKYRHTLILCLVLNILGFLLAVIIAFLMTK